MAHCVPQDHYVRALHASLTFRHVEHSWVRPSTLEWWSAEGDGGKLPLSADEPPMCIVLACTSTTKEDETVAEMGEEEPDTHVKEETTVLDASEQGVELEAVSMNQDVDGEAEETGISGLPHTAATQNNLVPAEPAIEGDDTEAQTEAYDGAVLQAVMEMCHEHPEQDEEKQSSTDGSTDTDQGAMSERSRTPRKLEEAYAERAKPEVQDIPDIKTLKRDNTRPERDINILRQSQWDDLLKARQAVKIHQDRIDELRAGKVTLELHVKNLRDPMAEAGTHRNGGATPYGANA